MVRIGESSSRDGAGLVSRLRAHPLRGRAPFRVMHLAIEHLHACPPQQHLTQRRAGRPVELVDARQPGRCREAPLGGSSSCRQRGPVLAASLVLAVGQPALVERRSGGLEAGARIRGHTARLTQRRLGGGETRALKPSVGAAHVDTPPKLVGHERDGQVGGTGNLHAHEARDRPGTASIG